MTRAERFCFYRERLIAIGVPSASAERMAFGYSALNLSPTHPIFMPVPGIDPTYVSTKSVEPESGALPPIKAPRRSMKPNDQPQHPVQTDEQLEAWGRKHLPLDAVPVIVKHDSAKARLSLLNFPFLEETVSVMDHGAKKYGVDNYMGTDPDPVNRFVSAAMRHLWAFLDGEILDPDSGLPHLAHAAANAMILHRRQMEGLNVHKADEVGELLGELYLKHAYTPETGKDYDVDN